MTMEPNQRVLPPNTSAVTIEVSLNRRRKDLPADSISAVQVKHDASVSMKLPFLKPSRYRSEAFVVLSSASPSAVETKFLNFVEHVPGASTIESQGSKYTRGALKANGEECNQCVSDHTGKLNGGINCRSREPEAAKSKRSNFNGNGCGSEEKALRKQRALDKDTTRHCSSLQRQHRVQFEIDNYPVNDPSTIDNCLEDPLVESKSSSLETEKVMGDCRKDFSSKNWNPINELKKFIEEEKGQHNLPNDDVASKEPCEQLETSTDSVESASEVNPLWVLDSITASVDKCNSSAYETIFEDELDDEIVLDSHSDERAQNACSGEAGKKEISGASVDGRTVPQKTEEGVENKRLSQGSDGSFGFEPHYEEDFSGYVEGKEYFKNLPTFHRLLTSAEEEELDDEQSQKNELTAVRLEEQIPGLHEQSDYAQDMMDTHAMRTEYWDYPYPSRSDALDQAMRSEDKSELLENLRMKIRGRLRQPGNSSSDSGCHDTDVNHCSIDESDSTHRIHSPKGQCQEVTQTQEETTNHTADFSKNREDEKIESPLETETSSPDQSSSNRRQILEGLNRLIASSEETRCSLPVPEDSNHQSGTPNRNSCIGSRSVNEAPSIPARPMTHEQLKFIHYENITIVKKRVNGERDAYEDSDKSSQAHSNTHRNKQGADIICDNESSRTEKNGRARNEESIAEPIDINLSDPEVLEATKRMQLAFRKRRELHGSRKFRSVQRMRAESDSISYRCLELGSSASLEKRNPFPGDVSMESCEVQMNRHHSLPPNFVHSGSECNLSGEDSLSTSFKNKDITKERICKKLSRQNSVSQYQPFTASLTERREQTLTESNLTNQSVNEYDQEIELCESANHSMVLSEEASIKEVSVTKCTAHVPSSSSKVCEMVKPNSALSETAEGEDVDKKLKCIMDSEQQPTNNSQSVQRASVPDALQEPDIDLKDPKVQDASKMIQQVFRRKKLLSKRSKGTVEEKACKKVQANKASSFSDTPIIKETPKASDLEITDSPSILYANTTVNVVIAGEDLDKHTLSYEQQLVDRTENTSTANGIESSDVPLEITPAPVSYQTYKGVMIVNDKLSKHIESDFKPPSPDGGNIVHADANANFRSSFDKSQLIRQASSISEASLGDEIDIDLLDAEVKAVTEKLQRVSFDEISPNDGKIQDNVSKKEMNLELKEQDAGNEISREPQSSANLINEPPVKEQVSETSKTNEDVNIDLSDPDVQKTAFKLQSAFWKKRTSSKNKSQTTSTKEAMRGKSEVTNILTCQNMSASATSKNENGSLIGNKNAKAESIGAQRNHNELDTNVKDTRELPNETSERQEALNSSLKCREHDKAFQCTNNDRTITRPQSSNTNTGNLVSTSSKKTDEIDIDLNDTRVKEVTKKIQNIFKRKRNPTKTGETPGKGESKKSIVRLKSNAAISLGSKHHTKPMISTSFLDRGEKGRKDTKASMVSTDFHGNTDDDEEMTRSSNRCGVGELGKINDGVVKDSKISDPNGTPGDKTELQRITESRALPSVDKHVSSKTDSTSDKPTTPIIPCDDGNGSTAVDDVNNSAHSGPNQSSLAEGAKGDKFNLDNNGSRPVSSVHYADVEPSQIPPSSSYASLLQMQDEVDIERLMTTSMTTREQNGHVKRSNSPVLFSLTSLTTAPLSRRTLDREDDVDNSRLKSTSTTCINGKSVHGYLDQASDDTEYETAYSDFSDRVDELERTLVQEADTTDLVQMETSIIHHHSPRFLIRPKNASCYHGDRVRFVCCITGSPRPDISWFASGKVIRPERDDRLKITDYSEDNDGNDGNDACALVSILDIVEVKSVDTGEYACVAINSQGQAFSSAQLNVEAPDPGLAKQSASDENDRLSDEPKNETSNRNLDNAESNLQDQVHISSASLPRQKVHALVGSKASFFCPVEGEPLPDVKWFKDDILYTCNHGDDRITIRVEGCIHCLHIRDISLSDAGTYVCSAANDNGMVLCVSLLEVQESSGSTEGNQHVKQRTPMLVITEPEIFRQSTKERESAVSPKTSNEETVVPSDDLNSLNSDTPNNSSRISFDEDGMRTVRDDTVEDTRNNPQRNSGGVNNGNTDEILSSVLSKYGPRESQQSICDARLSVVSYDGVTCKESNSSETYASAEGPPSDDNKQTKNKVSIGTFPSEGNSLTEPKHHKGSKRRSSRRNHVKSPTKLNHFLSPADKDITEFADLDDVNSLTRIKSSRKKRSSSRRKKSPIHSKNVERVRLDLEKAEELTEKVDSCLDIIDDLLTLTSYDENENETEEKLRQKLDTLVLKFGDSESDAGSLSSRRSTPSHRRKERLRKVDLLHMSDSNGEYLDVSDVNINVSKIHSDGNSWGQCSLEDSLKVMSELVGNISMTVRDPGFEADGVTQVNPAESAVNGREENLNNNNSIHRKGIAETGVLTGRKVKRTPLRDLLKHSLFSQDLMTTRLRRRPLPVTKSLDSIDDNTHIPRSSDGSRRHSFGSLYAPRSTRPSRHPLLRTLSIRRRNRAHSTDSSSSDDDIHERLQGKTIALRPRPLDNGQASDDCPSHAESTDSLPVHLEDKFQQFPDGDRLSSPISFGDSDCSLEEHNLPDPLSRTRLPDDVNFISGTGGFSEHAADQSAPDLFNGTIGEKTSSADPHRKHNIDQSENQSKRCIDTDFGSQHENTIGDSSKVVHGDQASRNGAKCVSKGDVQTHRIPQEIGSYTKDKEVDNGDGPPDTILNVSRNDSDFSSGVSPYSTDRSDKLF